MFHSFTWLAWLVAATLPAFTVRNPLYLVLILGAAWIVYLALGRSSPIGRSWGTFIRIGLLLLALTVPLNALASHYGAHVLFRLPANWPIVGGVITLEGVIAGAVNGLALLTILIVLAAFNSVVDHYQLLRLTPAFIFQAGMVASIAITFVPQMVAGAAEIRRAQQIRGHKFRGIRDLLPLALPLLATGLEKAIQLAETMEARGFASSVTPPSQRETVAIRLGLLGSLVAMLGGLFLALYSPAWATAGWVLAALGSAALVITFWRQGRRIRRTWYRRTRWSGRDTVLVVMSALVVAAVIAGRLTIPAAMTYDPYSGTLLPPFNPMLGAALLLLILPAALAADGRSPSRPKPRYASNPPDAVVGGHTD